MSNLKVSNVPSGFGGVGGGGGLMWSNPLLKLGKLVISTGLLSHKVREMINLAEFSIRL